MWFSKPIFLNASAFSQLKEKYPDAATLIRPVTQYGLRIAERDGYQPFHEEGALEHLYVRP